MLMQPGVHTGTMELMEAGNDPELLALGELLQADGAHRGGAAAAPRVWPLLPGAPAAGPVTPGGQLADGPGCSLLKGVRPAVARAAPDTQHQGQDDHKDDAHHRQEDPYIVIWLGE